MINNLQTIYPASSLLKKYIYCYYVIENTDVDFKKAHYSFPHTLNAISIYDNGSFVKSDQQISITGNQPFAPFCILQGKCQNPLLVNLSGSFSRITILFKPLGLNNFAKVPLGEIMGKETTSFTQWDSEKFDQLLKHIFSDGDIRKRISDLEAFLLSVYAPVNQAQLLQSLVYLSDFDTERSIEEISELVNIPLRTFNRLFRLHLGVSPVVHRQIAKFRHSLEDKIFDERFRKLTEICYNSNFYDQSYFNKLYKQLSGSNPKIFFKTVERVGDSKLVFKFIND